MQNKGALKFLVIALAIACAYQLSFTFITRNVENKAERYAEQFSPEERTAREQSYLDSMKSQTVMNLGFIKFTYKEAKEKEINLGLDLKGGMNVMLELSVQDVVVALASDEAKASPIFRDAVERASAQQKTSGGNFIDIFARTYDEISGGGQLASLFNTPELKDYITPTDDNNKVISVLKDQANSAIDNSFNVLRSRIDRFGVTQPNIQPIEGTGRILVELPGVKEPERVRKLLQGTASLEFWSTYNASAIAPMMMQADALVRELESANADVAGSDTTTVVTEAEVEVEETTTQASDILSEVATTTETPAADLSNEELARTHPLLSKLQVTQDGGPSIGYAYSYNMAAIDAYLAQPQVRALFPRDARFMWGAKPFDQSETLYQLFVIKANTRDGQAPLDGSVVVDARQEYEERGNSSRVAMSMNAEGASKWARLTADNVGNFIAIVLDGFVYSAPGVSGEITGGNSSITGNFTYNDATDLANVLRSGKLPAPARIVSDNVVGPSLGAESIRASMISFLLAFVLVMLYMIVFYNRAGFVASLALICNLFFLMGVLVSFGAVLTLPGIAGIVLTMGMAVDANVIIYERIKEELRAGKGLAAAVAAGYSNAMSAILDSNITTMITAIVLYIFGTGPVQGFATTLIIGIITSLFTSIFVTRLLFNARLNKGKSISFSNKLTQNFLANTHVDFIKIRKISYLVSAVLILGSIVSFYGNGMNYGVDFTGGRAFVVRFDQSVSDDQVRDRIHDVFAEAEGDDAQKSVEVKQFGNENQYQKRILTQYMSDDESTEATETVEGLLYDALSPLYAAPITLDEFKTTATNPNGIISADKVGASIAHETVRNSFIAVLFSLIAIGLYVILRFKRWQWGVGSVVALAHDAFLTIGLFSVFHKLLPFAMEVDQSFIAAILTIIGYSINDKVVIFDRIREYHALYPKRSIYDNINNAVNSTLSRTINTSGTTFVTLLAIFLFGGEVIRGFVFALMFGVVIGTLSSIFTATPVAYDLMNKKGAGKKTN